MVISLALIVFVVGLGLSQTTGNWTWFSRSGSLLVVLGVLFAYFNLDYRLERALHRTSRLSAKMIKRVAPQSRFLNHLSEANDQMEERLDDIPNKVKTIEVIIIGAGTFIWGFGDLIGTLV